MAGLGGSGPKGADDLKPCLWVVWFLISAVLPRGRGAGLVFSDLTQEGDILLQAHHIP